MWKYYKLKFCNPRTTDDIAIYRWDGATLQVLDYCLGKFITSNFESLQDVMDYKGDGLRPKIIAEGEDVYREAIIDCI